MRTRRRTVPDPSGGRARRRARARPARVAAPEAPGAWGGVSAGGSGATDPQIRPWGARVGPARARGPPPHAHFAAIHARVAADVRARPFGGRRARVVRPDVHAPHDPPTRPLDYAALSAGWAAALGTLLVAARDKDGEPVRPAEVVPLGVATF